MSKIIVPMSVEKQIRIDERNKYIREHNWKIDTLIRTYSLLTDLEVVMTRIDDVALFATQHAMILEGLTNAPGALGKMYGKAMEIAKEAGWMETLEEIAPDVFDRIDHTSSLIAILTRAFKEEWETYEISKAIKEPMAALREVAANSSSVRKRLFDVRQAMNEQFTGMTESNKWLAENWREIKNLKVRTKDRANLLIKRLENNPPQVEPGKKIDFLDKLSHVDDDPNEIANWLNLNLKRYKMENL